MTAYLMAAPSETEGSAAANEAASLLFEHFSFKILKETISDTHANVDVSISNIDMRLLARDLCREMTLRAASLGPDPEDPLSAADYFGLLCETLSSHTYPLTETKASVPLSASVHDRETVWSVLPDEAFQLALVSSFPLYMQDPETLPPQEVLDIYLNEFTSLGASDWVSYLHLRDTFSTYSETFASRLDETYADKLTQNFSYEIEECTREGNSASAKVRISSIDMKKVLESYQEKLLTYAKTGESITGDSTQLSDASAKLLLEALDEAAGSASRTVTVPVSFDGYTWHPQFTEEFTDAILGNLDEALEEFS